MKRFKKDKNEKPKNLKSDEIKTKKKLKRWKKTLMLVLVCLLSVVLVTGAGAYLYFKHIVSDPASQFNVSAKPQVENGNPSNKDVVNILLVGLDYNEERSGLAQKHTYNTDVMMVLAVDFNNKTVDMISLPRDSYVQMPNAAGIYKLNAAMKCGGGYPQGFSEVLLAAKWMLGGIPIDYYYSVTMPVIKDLVNTIGGIDYEVEFDFSVDNHSYNKGMQHMNGQAVLDYLRVRKNIEESGDLNRINRQKKMLFAIFKKMQQQNLWVKLPSILSSLKDQVMTNTTIGQTTALASLAYGLKDESIKMHSMGGTMASVFNYNFCITDQAARVALIKEVYGVTVPSYIDYDYDGVMKKWAGMMYDVYQPNASALISYVQDLIDRGSLPTSTPSSAPTSNGSPGNRVVMAAGSNEINKKLQEVKTLYAKIKSLAGQGETLVNALGDLKNACINLALRVNHPLKSESKWEVKYTNQYDVY